MCRHVSAEAHAMHQTLVSFMGRYRCHFNRGEMGCRVAHHSVSQLSSQIDESHSLFLPVCTLAWVWIGDGYNEGLGIIPNTSHADEIQPG